MTEKFGGIPTPQSPKDQPENSSSSAEEFSTLEKQHEEVQSVFEKLLEGEKCETIQEREDEEGLYLWEIRVKTKDGTAEYSYMRKGQYPEGQASATAVHVTFFDKEGFPTGGDTAAKFIDGKWKLFETEDLSDIVSVAVADQEEEPHEISLAECEPHIEEFETMITPLQNEEILGTLNKLKTEKEAKNNEERKLLIEALKPVVAKLKFLKEKTSITEEEHDRLRAKYKKISRAVGIITGSIGRGIVDHDR